MKSSLFTSPDVARVFMVQFYEQVWKAPCPASDKEMFAIVPQARMSSLWTVVHEGVFSLPRESYGGPAGTPPAPLGNVPWSSPAVVFVKSPGLR